MQQSNLDIFNSVVDSSSISDTKELPNVPTPSVTNNSDIFNTVTQGDSNNEIFSKYATNTGNDDNFLDDVLAGGRAIRAGIISGLQGQGYEATEDNIRAAWNSSKSDVTTSFMDAINQSFDEVRIAPEGTFNPVLESVAKSPRLSAALTTVLGLTGDMVIDPINLAGGAGAWLKATKKGQQVVQTLRARKADKIINKLNTRADELVAINPKLGKEQALERALLEKDAYKPLLIEMRGVTEGGLALKPKGTYKPYVPRESKNIVGKMTDDFFTGVGKVNEVMTKPIGNLIDDGVRPIISRVSEINPALGGKLMDFEYKLNTRLHADVSKVQPFIEKFHKLNDKQQVELSKHLYNRDFASANSVFAKVEGMKEDFYTSVKPVLDDSFARMRATSDDIDFLPQYFPRYLEPSKRKDFMKKMDIQDTDGLQQQVYDEISKQGRHLTPTEYADVYNKGVRAPSVETVLRKISPERARNIEVLGDDLMEFYGTADKAILSHLRDVNHAVARRGFLGKIADDAPAGTSIDDSIGKLVQQEKAAGRLTYDEADELTKLLSARFVGGEKSMNRLLAGAKGIGYMATIANPYSAMTQLGDLGTASYVLNPINAAKGVAKAITRKSDISIDEFGLDLMAELGDLNKSAKALNNMFTASGFRAIDRLGKQTIVNGSFSKWSNVGNNPKLNAQLRAKFQPLYGKGRTDQLIKDFGKYKDTKVITDDMKFVAFSDLLDIQPVVMSSMPKAYLNNPNARIAWQLKTFMLKQMDLVRNTAIKNIRQGKVVEGTTDLARYGILVGGANTASTALKETVKGWISGEDRLEEMLDKEDGDLGMLVAANLFKTFGYSSYLGNQLKQGQVGDVASGFIMPPMANIAADTTEKMAESIQKGEIDPLIDMIRYAPVLGNEFKVWFSDE